MVCDNGMVYAIYEIVDLIVLVVLMFGLNDLLMQLMNIHSVKEIIVFSMDSLHFIIELIFLIPGGTSDVLNNLNSLGCLATAVCTRGTLVFDRHTSPLILSSSSNFFNLINDIFM